MSSIVLYQRAPNGPATFLLACCTNVSARGLPWRAEKHLTVMHWENLCLDYQLRAPAEPVPSPIPDPIDPPENPDVPVREPDPEGPGQM
ncbi:MAG TPA: hypothetical protein VGS27_15625 [Candidatus Sulfotelmatobacter sp.]|nr:hypothetical protein [Candidatus Sulfotelmatobacter sp.]